MPRRSANTPIGGLMTLINLPAPTKVMNVTVLYEDSPRRSWAGEVYAKLETVLGCKAVRGTWWNVADLSQPGVLAGAVSKAIRSDMIVVAVSSSEGLPLPFYYWINSWLPHRMAGTGALVALLGRPAFQNRESGRVRKYLKTVSRRARMDLLVAERSFEEPLKATARKAGPRL